MISHGTGPAAKAAHDESSLVLNTPWDQRILPTGFGIDERGVYFQPEEQDSVAIEVTSAPLIVDCLFRKQDNEDWSLALTWQTLDGRPAHAVVSFSVVTTKRATLIETLARGGLLVLDEGYFRQYLTDSIRDPNLPQHWGVTQLGFATVPVDADTPIACFVLPDQTLYHDPDAIPASVQLLPDARSPAHAAYSASGTLDEWQTMMDATRGNHLLTFTLATSFAGTLLEVSGVESGGFNLSGPTSCGKTTALQVSASVWGSGAATNQASRTGTLINTWHTTNNALESLAQAHSGMPLLLDEIGSHTSGALPIYALFAGQGKGRMSGSGGLRDRATWQTLLLSTGEIDLDQHLQRQRSGKQTVDPGERNRLLNIPIDDLSPRRDPSKVEALKRDCGRLFGTAGPAFVQGILNVFEGDAEVFRATLQSQVEQERNDFCIALEAEGWTLDTSHRRVIPRFALISVAGQWAAAPSIGVLPHTADEIRASIYAVMQAWLSGQTFQTQDEQVIATFREYVQCHEGQMRSTANPDRMPSPCAGFRDPRHRDGPRLLLNETQFKTICAGLNPKSAQATLKRAGILHTHDDQCKAKVSIQEFGINRTRFYWLKLDQLLADPTLDDPTDENAPSPRPVVVPLHRDQTQSVRF